MYNSHINKKNILESSVHKVSNHKTKIYKKTLKYKVDYDTERTLTMTKILFICHGNICRSPMAEFVMKDLVKKSDLSDDFIIASAATSTEEIDNLVHPGTRKKLAEVGISTTGKTATQLKKSDYNHYDYLIGMDERNRRNINKIIGSDPLKKVSCLLDFTKHPRDIADPWYTGNFDQTYTDILEGCQALLKEIQEK